MRSEEADKLGRRPRPALAVGAGIFLSRLAGFGRDVAIAAFFGTTVAADAYAAALRIPNIIRNLLGEGTLSASFIPVYSGLLGRGADSDARRLAGVVLSLLLVLATALSGIGVLLAPWLTRLLVPGWPADWVLEMPCRVGRVGIEPIPAEPLPLACFGLLAQVKAYEILAVEAAVHGDRRAAYQALMTHPLGPTADRVQGVLEDLLETHRAHLPQFWA